MNFPQQNNTIFWIEIASIKPNPQQPRKDFNDDQLKDLAESIKQYGILQPLLVVRQEKEVPTGTSVEYELISGERRWRAAKIAGLLQVPVIIRKEPPEKVKLELALIENIQRENLNPIEEARAFKQLAEEFNLKHHEIALKIGKSRVYVTNAIRLLNLPEEMTAAVAGNKINPFQGRALLMLTDKPEAQKMLFKDVIDKKLNSVETENIARRIAYERARKQEGLPFNEETRGIENRLAALLGTRVYIDRKGNTGKISISFSSEDELKLLFKLFCAAKEKNIFKEENSDILPEDEPSAFLSEKARNEDEFETGDSDESAVFLQDIASPEKAPDKTDETDKSDNFDLFR